jgi:hypothetical protein
MTPFMVILAVVTVASIAASLFFFARYVNVKVEIDTYSNEVLDLESANNHLLRQLNDLKGAKKTVITTKLPQPNDWTAGDCVALKNFLKSEVGHALMQRARAMEFNRAVTNAAAGTNHAAGITTGINQTLNWIESLASDEMHSKLSRPAGDQAGQTNTTDGDQDDAALVEKYSP